MSIFFTRYFSTRSYWARAGRSLNFMCISGFREKQIVNKTLLYNFHPKFCIFYCYLCREDRRFPQTKGRFNDGCQCISRFKPLFSAIDKMRVCGLLLWGLPEIPNFYFVICADAFSGVDDYEKQS
jgi:hypothetical protein